MIKGLIKYGRIKLLINDKKVKLFVTDNNLLTLDYGLSYLTTIELREIADYLDYVNAQKTTTSKKKSGLNNL